jgi:hypothetical protein
LAPPSANAGCLKIKLTPPPTASGSGKGLKIKLPTKAARGNGRFPD